MHCPALHEQLLAAVRCSHERLSEFAATQSVIVQHRRSLLIVPRVPLFCAARVRKHPYTTNIIVTHASGVQEGSLGGGTWLPVPCAQRRFMLAPELAVC